MAPLEDEDFRDTQEAGWVETYLSKLSPDLIELIFQDYPIHQYSS